MKILFISDIPPCENLTAGLVLSALVRLVPKDAICFYIVANSSVDIEFSPEFANIPTKLDTKPNENWNFLPQRRSLKRLSNLASYIGENVNSRCIVDSKIEKAIQFGREQKVDRVWAVLQGQTTIRMARKVAEGLAVPLHTHVWDPFSWWAKAHGLSNKTRNIVQNEFDNAIKSSFSVATASEPMAELYQNKFGVTSVPIIASHEASFSKQPAPELNKNDTILIGMAGQFYASAEWLCLLEALRLSDWQVSGKNVKVVVLGPQEPPGVDVDDKVTYFGWKKQSDAVSILSLCDVLYCPYPFNEDMKEVSSYSFPSKLVLYLAAGRPIIFHGPLYSSPARYLEERKCGLTASKIFPSAIYNELERLISNPDLYKTLSENTQKAFLKDFTLKTMRNNFSKFINNDDILLEAEYTQHALSIDDPKFKHLEEINNSRKYSSFYLTVKRVKQTLIQRKNELRKLIRCVVSRIPPFKRFYIEIDYYARENEALRKQLCKLTKAEVVKEADEDIALHCSRLFVSDKTNFKWLSKPYDFQYLACIDKKISEITLYTNENEIYVKDNIESNPKNVVMDLLRFNMDMVVDEIVIDSSCLEYSECIVSAAELTLSKVCFMVDTEIEISDIKSKFPSSKISFISEKEILTSSHDQS